MSNYPEGVTGAEDQIAGPLGEDEIDIQFDCIDCDFDGWVSADVTRWSTHDVINWECPGCGALCDREEYR